MEVRPATLNDAPGLIALWREVWPAAYEATLGPETVWAMLSDLEARGLRAMLPGKDERGYCAVSDGRIVGSAIVAERGGTAYLWGMYVHPTFQRTGIGARLLAAAVSSVSTAERLEARVMQPSPGAIAFYRKHGFRAVGEEMTEIMAALPMRTLVMAVPVAGVTPPAPP